MGEGVIIGIDPGTEKSGVAVVDLSGRCLWRSVVQTSEFAEVVSRLAGEHPKARIVIGDGTGSQAFIEELRKAGVVARLGEPYVIDERYSTEEARLLYLVEHRRGWRRFVPLGLQTPSVPVDGYVAEVVARRYLKQQRAPGETADGGKDLKR